MRAYRSTLLLCGVVLLGWLADAALGGGAAHAIGWVLALVVIGGISALTGTARRRLPTTMPPVMPSDGPAVAGSAAAGYEVRPARPDEFAELIEVEIAADRLFPLAGYGETPGPASTAELAGAAAVLVVGEPPVGYARLEVVDGQAHLEGLSVRPRYMKEGRGRALVEAGLDWARQQGYRQLTLCTFADVPWNGPFYRKLGFVELTEPTDLTPGLAERRATERRLGLDDMGRRIVMVRPVERLER